MKLIAHQLSVYINISILVYCNYILFSEAEKNTIAFERVECTNIPNSGFSIDKCKVKLISRNQLTVDFAFTLKSKISTFFVHFVLFYKSSSNEYRPFLVNMWEDFCAYLEGDERNLILGRLFPMFRPYTNVNHTCPYEPGPYFATISNISLNAFDPIQLVPSGRYRFEISGHYVFKGPAFGKSRFYGSISDHRITIF